MAGSVNKVILVGNLGKDPEVRSTQDGSKIVNLTLATSETWNDRTSGERKYCLSNMPPKASLRRLASAIKARWVCEQAHQQVKEDLGLDHFEGRSWTGLHRHALMTMLAYAFLQHRRLTQAGRGKKAESGPTTASADPSSRTPGHAGQPGPTPHTMPALRSAAPSRIIKLNAPKSC